MNKPITIPSLLVITIILTGFISCQRSQNNAEKGFSYVKESIPNIILDLRYYSSDNFMGVQVDGYKMSVLLLSTEATKALAKVQEELNDQGLGLMVFDAYRPQKAVDHFVRWAEDPSDTLTKRKYYPDLPKDRLFELGYISARSGHTRGSTLDLTIADLASGNELDMGSPWDFFGEISHHDSPLVDEVATANRNLLKNVMVKYGFRPYANEWWHYTLEEEPFEETYFDFDIK